MKDVVSVALIECENLNAFWDEENRKNVIKSLISMLKEMDTELPKKIRDKVSIKFKGRGFACCYIENCELVFGERLMVNNFDYYNYGYARESKYIEEICDSSIKNFIYPVVHEWCHLYNNGINKHNKEFFLLIKRKFLQFFNNF